MEDNIPATAGNGQRQGFTDSSLRHCVRLLDDGLLNIQHLLPLLVGKRPTLSLEERQSIISALLAMENFRHRLSKLITKNL